MANTKKLTAPERKKTKRTQRLEIKAKWSGLSRKDRRAFRSAHKNDKVNFLPWYRQHEQQKKDASAAPATA